eukprot:7214623-Pyramimonas_sp.AAC.1
MLISYRDGAVYCGAGAARVFRNARCQSDVVRVAGQRTRRSSQCEHVDIQLCPYGIHHSGRELHRSMLRRQNTTLNSKACA